MRTITERWRLFPREFALDGRHLWTVFAQANVPKEYSKLPLESAK
jgi:hypothetical protein